MSALQTDLNNGLIKKGLHNNKMFNNKCNSLIILLFDVGLKPLEL